MALRPFLPRRAPCMDLQTPQGTMRFVRLAVAVGAVAMVGACAELPPRPHAQHIHRELAQLEQERAPARAFDAALRSRDATVRARAAWALARLERLDALPLLLEALHDPDARVQQAAIFGLGQLDLALKLDDASHERARDTIEAALVDMWGRAQESTTRRALVRALGRISDSAGLDALTALAASQNALSGEAFAALGVSGARRQASRARDDGLIAAVNDALRSVDSGRRTAAAYTLFRQKLRAAPDAVRAASTSADPQTRILVMRSAPQQDDETRRALVASGLKDRDWRVVVEAVRAASAPEVRDPPMADVLMAVEGAARVLQGEGAGAEAHVVREGCAAVARAVAPPPGTAVALDRVLTQLVATGVHSAASCACAVALDVVTDTNAAVRRCAPGDAPDRAALREIVVATHRRVSTGERAERLGTFLVHDDRSVRLAAALALADIHGSAPARIAAAHLAGESDPGVANALLGTFAADTEHASVLENETLRAVARRFQGGTTFEELEPLVAAVSLARTRETATARAVVTEAHAHPDARVRDAATGVPAADRSPGPRAAPIASPPPERLPWGARVRTSRGIISISFMRDIAPATVANFAALARAGRYDGAPFHRVVADFVAQGGDPRGDGDGGPGYTIACENSDEQFVRGAVGMATSGKDTGGSQFFFTHSWQPHLDGRYTLFAHTVDGLDALDALQPDDVILTIDIVDAPPTVP